MDANAGQNQLVCLLRETASGDHEAFEHLYGLTAGQLFAVGLRMLKHKERAEEALQEAFVKVWHHAGEYHVERGSVQTWMAAIMRYRCLDKLRSIQRRPAAPYAGEHDLVSDELEPVEVALLDEDAGQLRQCLGALQVNQRQVISLAFLGGLTHSEITATLAQPLGTVKSLIRRGLASLRRCLQQ